MPQFGSGGLDLGGDLLVRHRRQRVGVQDRPNFPQPLDTADTPMVVRDALGHRQGHFASLPRNSFQQGFT
jgi:hypothetical protein